MKYRFVTTDEDGNEAEVAAGEHQSVGVPYDEGTTVVLKGVDGVERSWRITRTISVPYAGITVYVEPAD